MYVRRFITILGLLLIGIISCVACGSKGGSDAELSPTTSVQGGEGSAPQANQSEFVPEEGMTELRLMCEFSYNIPFKNANALNWYLKEKGYPFYVSVISGVPFTSVESIDMQHQKVLDAKDKQDPIDLLMSTTSKGYYSEEIDQGVYLPLETYLSSEKGKTLRAAFPENYWNLLKRTEVTAPGIYGIYSSDNMLTTATLHINTAVFEAAGIELPREMTIDNLSVMDEWFEVLWSSGVLDQFGIVSPLYMESMSSMHDFAMMHGMYSDGWGEYLQYTDDHWNAVKLLEDESVCNNLALFQRWEEEGNLMFTDVRAEEKNYAILLSSGTQDLKQDLNGAGEHVKEYILHRYIDTNNVMLGIASWSKNADLAFDLMTLLYTDADAASLLYYGEYYDAVSENTPKATQMMSWANYLLLDKTLTESEKNAYIDMLSKATFAPRVDRRLLEKMEQPEELAASEIINPILKELFECEEGQTFEERLAWYKEEASKIGYDAVVEAWNDALSR